jgi:hypothetical protein
MINIEKIPMAYLPLIQGGRTFELLEDIEVELSDGYKITLTKGTKTDLMSVPGWLWSFLKPIDKAFIGDLIHDWLWINKQGQIKHFGSIYKARKFADEERKKWRLALAPELKFKTLLTHAVIRFIGGFYYSEQFKIPN